MLRGKVTRIVWEYIRKKETDRIEEDQIRGVGYKQNDVKIAGVSE